MSLSISSVNQSLSAQIAAYNFEAGEDVTAVLDALNHCVWNNTTQSLQQALQSFNAHVEQLGKLKNASLALSKATPIDGSVPTVKLGTDLQGSQAVKADLEAADLSLATTFRNEISIDVIDSKGKPMLQTGWHVATESQLASGKAAPLQGASSVEEWHATTDSFGNTTNFYISLDKGVLTARAADVAALQASVADSQAALRAQVDSEALFIRSTLEVAVKKRQGGDQSFDQAREHEDARTDKRHSEQRDNANEAIRRQIEELERLERHDAAQPNRD